MVNRNKSLIVVTLAWVTLAWSLAATAQSSATTSEPSVVAAPKGNPYRVAATLPARIISLTAEPGANIQPGQSVNIVWRTENPTRVTIEPDLGRVPARGTRLLSPKATTTYTLTVRGAGDVTLTKTLTVNVAGTTPINVSAAPEVTKTVPRTSDGKPDLTGVYGTAFNLGAAPAAARPKDAPPPSTEARGYFGAPAALKSGAESFRITRPAEDSGPTANCMPLIGPQAYGVPYQFQLVQNARYVVLMHEYPGVFRVIPISNNPHPVDPDPSWMGDSIAHWDGDTLVVDSVGYNDKTELSVFRHSESLHMIERFRRTDFDTLHLEITIEDPNVFAKPWVLSRDFNFRPELTRIDEFVCENNRDYSKLFKK